MKPFLIYGSGDRGTADLKALFTRKGILYRFHDIRIDADYMKQLQNANLHTVPQVYDAGLAYVGDYRTTADWLATHPDVDSAPIFG